jgi:hypothetical protein
MSRLTEARPLMPDARKLAAIVLSASVLGAQLVAIAPSTLSNNTYNTWFWPFMDYPMYSTAHVYSDAVLYFELRGRSCDSQQAIELSFDDLHMDRSSLQLLLHLAASEALRSTGAGSSATGLIDHMLQSRDGSAICSAEVWEHRQEITWNGPRGTRSPPQLVRTWSVSGRSRRASGSTIADTPGGR